MIIGAILGVILLALEKIISFLPLGSLPAAVSSGFSSLVGYMYVVNGFFPIDTLLYLTGLAITLELVLVVWHLSLTLWHLVRGK